MLYPSLSTQSNLSALLNAIKPTSFSDLINNNHELTPNSMIDLIQGLNQMNNNANNAPPTNNGPVNAFNGNESLEAFRQQYGDYLQPLPKWANTNFTVPEQFHPYFDKYSKQFGVPYWLAAAVAQQESSFRPNLNAWPNDGAGIMQLMPDEAKRYGVTNVLDPEQNIRGGINLLADLYKQTGRWDLAVAAYNAGLGRVKGGVIGFNNPSKSNFGNRAFTINHVWKILNMWGYR